MRTIFLLAAVGLLTGCTTVDLGTTFTKPNENVFETTWDEWQCRRQVADAPHTPDLVIGGAYDGGRLFAEAQQRDRLLAQCMQARGYAARRPQVWYRPVMRHWN